ncbi:unnamed protein product [Adineta ricciae]|uniref:Uncharacterized protein n=1 Tax=Adineta ricciae TaxID=249248 RepID=A0A816ABE6_ADIRI|nr:unnamed protein product [Adineta ricciae]
MSTSGIIPLRPHFTPTTDKGDDIVKRNSVAKQYFFRHTPDSYFFNLRDNNKGHQEENFDSMDKVREHNQNTKQHLPVKLTREFGTQSGKPKRSIGTMSDPIGRQDSGNKTPPPTLTSNAYNERKSPKQKEKDSEDNRRSESFSSSRRVSENNRKPDETPPRSPPRNQPYHSHTPSPALPHNTSPNKKGQSSKFTTETDTSLDGMPPKKNQGVQSDPRSTKDVDTSTYPSSKHQVTKLTPMNQVSHLPNYEEHPNKPTSTKTYVVRPTDKEDSTNEPKCYADNKPITIRPSNKSPDENHTRKSPIALRPGTYVLSTDEKKTTTAYSDENSVEKGKKAPPPPYNYGEQHEIPPTRESPVLSIGTEHIIQQSPDNEHTTPLETPYIEDPNRSFHLANSGDSPSNKKRVVLLRVLNSAQTYIFEQQPSSNKSVHQSRSNTNFYLASSPTFRSFNTSPQVNDTTVNVRTHPTDPDDVAGHHLVSQYA